MLTLPVSLVCLPLTSLVFRWEVCACAASEGQFNQVSFVNAICTLKGGTHANMVADTLAKKLLTTKTLKKHKKLKPAHVKSHIWVFVNAMIENPSFDSQTKEAIQADESHWSPSHGWGRCGARVHKTQGETQTNSQNLTKPQEKHKNTL